MARALRPPGPSHRYKLPPTGVEALTLRQLQCLYLAAHGMTNADIGHMLGIAGDTANAHLCRAYRKLGVADRTQAVVAVLRHVMRVAGGLK